MSGKFLHDWDALPLRYASQAWLSRVTGIKLAAIAKTMRRTGAESALTPFAQRRFGDYASTMRFWVEAWGAERVLAFLDKYDTAAAEVLRSGLDKLGNEEQDRAHSYRVHELRKRERLKKRHGVRALYNSRLVDALASQPVGLVPSATIATIVGVSHSVITAYMQREGIALFSDRQVGFPHGVGSWDKIVAAWGLNRTKAWVETSRPQLMPWFDRRAFPAAKRTEVSAAPLGCLPDGVIAVACGVTVVFVRDLRNELGIGRFFAGGFGAFPEAERSFGRLVAQMGHSEARAWLAERAPMYLTDFDADTKPKPERAPPPTPVAVAVAKRKGEALRQKMRGQIVADQARKADSVERDAASVRKCQVTPSQKVEAAPAGRVETFEEWLARGGRVTRLVGAGSADVGRVQA